MTESIFKKINNDIVTLLQNELPSYLTYHNLEHTLYILNRVIHIGTKEGISKPDMYLLKIAALCHDVGFVKTGHEHERISCEIMTPKLKQYGISNTDIEKICGMIMATKIPQKPHNLLEKILADADLEYLGTNRFSKGSERLYQELLHFNPKLSRDEWKSIQIEFLKKHHYHTDFCKRYKEYRKIKNMESLK